jgi:hypothetical protein
MRRRRYGHARSELLNQWSQSWSWSGIKARLCKSWIIIVKIRGISRNYEDAKNVKIVRAGSFCFARPFDPPRKQWSALAEVGRGASLR